MQSDMVNIIISYSANILYYNNSVAIPRDIDVIFGIISKTNVARFGKENSHKYFISVPIFWGYAPVYGENYKLSTEYWIFVSL
jgi:hypothetical protein